MKKKAKKFAQDKMLSKFTAEDMLGMLLEEREIFEKKRIEENINIIDQQFRELVTFIGRDITEEEESAILDIVDEYTPKDKDGNYLCSLLPFEYAWEIYKTIKNF